METNRPACSSCASSFDFCCSSPCRPRGFSFVTVASGSAKRLVIDLEHFQSLLLDPHPLLHLTFHPNSFVIASIQNHSRSMSSALCIKARATVAEPARQPVLALGEESLNPRVWEALSDGLDDVVGQPPQPRSCSWWQEVTRKYSLFLVTPMGDGKIGADAPPCLPEQHRHVVSQRLTQCVQATSLCAGTPVVSLWGRARTRRSVEAPPWDGSESGLSCCGGSQSRWHELAAHAKDGVEVVVRRRSPHARRRMVRRCHPRGQRDFQRHIGQALKNAAMASTRNMPSRGVHVVPT